MQKTLIYIFNSLIISFLVLTSCIKNSEVDNEIAMLKNKIKKDSLNLLEMNNLIYKTEYIFDSISLEDKELASISKTKKTFALTKIKHLNNMLKDKQIELHLFENELNTQNSALPRIYISELNTRITKKTNYYNDLLKEIELQKNETIYLSELIKEKDEKFISNNNVINELEEKYFAQNLKLEKLKAQIIETEKQVTKAKQTTAQTYYDLSNDLKDLADKTSGILAKKKKKNLLQLAYQYYTKAYEFGFGKAKLKMELMENDKKYSKYLEN